VLRIPAEFVPSLFNAFPEDVEDVKSVSVEAKSEPQEDTGLSESEDNDEPKPSSKLTGLSGREDDDEPRPLSKLTELSEREAGREEEDSKGYFGSQGVVIGPIIPQDRKYPFLRDSNRSDKD
jgi:hypothetical protein